MLIARCCGSVMFACAVMGRSSRTFGISYDGKIHTKALLSVDKICLRVRLSLEMHTVQDQSDLLDESYYPFVLLV
jgi:hypothetical protein